MKLKSASYKELENCRPLQVLQNALAHNRLGHAIILRGSSIPVLEEVALELASSILENNYPNINNHPDFFTLRPVNKMRQINVENTRELVKKIQLTPREGSRKVALIYEADRMNSSSANAFLKTLEEPPLGTIIFLLTTRPYSLLDTIRSRCLNFSLPSTLESIQDPDWINWLQNYSLWTQKLQTRPANKKEASHLILSVYTMIVDFDRVLKKLSKATWEKHKPTDSQSESLENEEELALKTGIEKNLRQELFTEISLATQAVAPLSPKLPRVIDQLEEYVALLEVNLNELTALEAFFLQALKIWTSPY